MRLDKFPRLKLTFGPTPIEKLQRLSDHLGGRVEIWAKREDCNSGLAFGGNKVRKLEYLMPEAIAQSAQMVDLAGEKPSALLCYERDPAGCHRTLLLSAVTPDAEAVHLYA